jgi:hypothetical protein
MFTRMGRPHIDLFASSLNHQLQTFFAWGLDEKALATDAFTQDWSGMATYAFPPLALIPRVLLRVAKTPKCSLLLVAPLWPRQLWFPRLL